MTKETHSTNAADEAAAPKYAFCESVLATPISKWHIRELTDKGLRLTGGIDSPSLCALINKGWDLDVPIDLKNIKRYNTCLKCVNAYKRLTGKS